MGDKKSLLREISVRITDNILINIPTVGEVLDDEFSYYQLVHQITASPYSMMVQLDNVGIDFTQVTAFDVFMLYAPYIFSNDLRVIFGNTFSELYDILSNEDIKQERKEKALLLGINENGDKCMHDVADDVFIDEYIYENIATTLRKINLIEKDNRRPGNDAAKKYLIDKRRRYMKRHAKDEVSAYLENLVVAMVNKQEFKYNYEETMEMSIYKFNRSVNQVQHVVNFDNVMAGIYAGSVDASKIKDKSVLNFIKSD